MVPLYESDAEQLELLRKLSDAPKKLEQTLSEFCNLLALALGRSYNFMTLTDRDSREALLADSTRFGDTELIAAPTLARSIDTEFHEVLSPGQDFRYALIARANHLPEIHYYAQMKIHSSEHEIGLISLVDEQPRGPLTREERDLLATVARIAGTTFEAAQQAHKGLLSLPVVS